jgi:hypothetical protein
VLDLTRARAIVEIGDGWVTAEAGATMVAIEAAVRETGQELWMYPSTAQSTTRGPVTSLPLKKSCAAIVRACFGSPAASSDNAVW